MPTFFWVAQAANGITLAVALAALLIVAWLGPRRWTNQSFGCFLAAMCLWMGGSILVRLLVNVPALGGRPDLVMNWVALGFALLGITLFWFVESFYPIPRLWRLAANLLGVAVYGAFLVLLVRNGIVTEVRRGDDGGIAFGISAPAVGLSAFHFLYDGVAIWLLLRNRAWRDRPWLLVGTAIIVSTSVLALLMPAIPLQTYTVALAALFMAYEVVQQQLFSPLLQLNRHLEAEVERRTAELARSLEAQERVRSELAAARSIQISLLPHVTPSLPNFHVAGRSLPALEVGGDFFAYHAFADGRLGVAVGDASGKGIPAALLMALALNTFETLVDTYDDQGALLNACNLSLAPRMQQSRQNTAFLSVVLDASGSHAAVANAGLVSPLLWRDGRVSYVESFGLPLGATSHARYSQQTVALQPGDCVLLLSDGIVEAMNSAGELWGFERLEATFATHGARPPHELVDALLDAVRAFIVDAPQHDDMTLVAIQACQTMNDEPRSSASVARPMQYP